jgi:antirestriction protein ArdC
VNLSATAQASLDKVIDRFKAGDLSPIVKVARIHLDPSAPASRWTFSNKVLAFVQTGQIDCRGFRQWQEVGRQVVKGAKAAFILRPKTVRKENDEGEVETFCIGFAGIPVFSIDVTEGEPLPDYAPAELPPLHDVAQRLGAEVSWLPVPADRLGDYSPSRDKIRVGTQDPSVFFHELAHAAHKRVLGDLQGGQDAGQETVAELTAAVLMDLYGLGDRTGNAWRYIEAYNPKDPLAAVCKALADVSQILDLLFQES